MRTLDRVVLLLLGVGVLTLVLGLRAVPAQDSGQRLASADVLTLVEDVLRTGTYADPRMELETELVGQMRDMQAQLQFMSQQLQSMQPGDPQGQQIYNTMQAKQAELQQFQQSSLERFQQLSADQAKETYAMVRAATSVVAEREGFSHVIANRASAEIGEAPTLTAVTQEILARPMAVGSDRNDLTPMVRAELGLPEPGSEPEANAEDAVNDAAQDAGEAADQATEPPAP